MVHFTRYETFSNKDVPYQENEEQDSIHTRDLLPNQPAYLEPFEKSMIPQAKASPMTRYESINEMLHKERMND